MPTVSQPTYFNLQAFTALGALGVGMRLYCYTQGTTTLKNVYTDAAGTILHTLTSDGAGGSYIALNARGELPAPLYLTSGAYDLTLKTDAGATVWTRRADPVGADLAASGGAASIGFLQSGTGAVARTAQAKMREFVTPEDFGAVGDGVTSDATAILNAVATGKSILLGVGKNYVIDSVVPAGNLIGQGADTNQSTFTLTVAGQLKPNDEWVEWRGFLIQSAVNSKTFVKVSFSYFKWDNFYMLGTGTAQVGIEFDAAASLYQCAITNHRINGVATPYSVTGAQAFNNNQIGSDNSYVQAFTTALSISAVAIFGANTVRGYFETGTNFITTTANVRDNTFAVWLDAVTNAVNSSVSFPHNNWPVTPPEQFISTGAGAVAAQSFVEKIKFRACLITTDQTLPDQTNTKIQWNSETFDTDAAFTLSPNHQFSAPRAMKLLVVAQADISLNLANGDRVLLLVYKNGLAVTEAKEYVAGGTNGARPRIIEILDLAKNDYVEIFAYANETAGASSHLISAGTSITYFCGTEL